MKKINAHFVSIFEKMTGGRFQATLMQGSLLLMLLLVPFLIVPSFTDMFGPIKQAFLIVLSALALFGWSLHVYRQRAWDRRKGWLIWTPMIVLVGVIISAIMSQSGYIAWIGAGAQGFTAVLPFMAMVFVYAMVMHIGENKVVQRRVVCASMIGVLVVMIYGALEYFGVSLLPSNIGYAGLSLTGTFESMMILGSLMSVTAAGVFATADKPKTDTWAPNIQWRWVLLVLGALNILLTIFFIMVSDRWASEVVLLVGSAALVGLGLYSPRKFASPSRMFLPMGLMVFAMFMLIFSSPFVGRIPAEVAPNLASGWEIGVATLNADGLFGSGPGTWLYDFTRFKPETFNDGQFWQVNFDHASSHMLTLFATWGIVPTVLLLVFFGWVIITMFDALILRKSREGWQTIAVLSSVWLGLLASRFVYSSDVVIELMFWVFTGLLVANIAPHTQKLRFDKSERASLATSFAVVVTGILFVFSLMASTQWILGEVAISNAAEVQDKVPASDEFVNAVGRAVKINNWNAGYYRALAFAHLQRVDALAEDVEANADLIVEGAGFAQSTARRAIELEPLDTRGHQLLGEIYSSLRSVISGADELALVEFKVSAELDPANPLSQIRLARALLRSVDVVNSLEGDDDARGELVLALLADAETAIDEAARLRPNYAPTFYTRTLMLDRQGRLEEAIEQMKPLVANTPKDAVLRFELGVLQLRADHKDLALKDFQIASQLAPTYANARWYLVALYEETGELEAAINELEALNTLNPEDETVLEKLNLLRQGLASEMAAEDVEPLEGAEPSVE